MKLSDYFKDAPAKMVLISHDILELQVTTLNDYKQLVEQKDREISTLLSMNDLLKAQKGGLETRLKKAESELQFYRNLPRIDTKG